MKKADPMKLVTEPQSGDWGYKIGGIRLLWLLIVTEIQNDRI
jgi:hypothetical protein